MRQGLTCAPAVVWLLLVALVPPTECQAGAATAPSVLPDERLGIRTAPLLLLSRPDVRADLGLSAGQSDDAERAITELYTRAAALKGVVGPQAIKARREIDDAQRQWFTDHLSPGQLNRLVQIDLQWEGPSALISRPVVSDTLGLTPEQQSALKRAVQARNAALATSPSAEPAQQTLARQALALLTPEQKARWRGMLGNPFVPRLAASKTGPGAGR